MKKIVEHVLYTTFNYLEVVQVDLKKFCKVPNSKRGRLQLREVTILLEEHILYHKYKTCSSMSK